MTPAAPQVLTNPMATPGVAGQLSRAPLKMPANGKPAMTPVKIMAGKAMARVVDKPIQTNPRARPPQDNIRSGLVPRACFPKMRPPKGREIIPSSNTVEPTMPAVLGSRWMLLINRVLTQTPAAMMAPKLPNCAPESSQIMLCVDFSRRTFVCEEIGVGGASRGPNGTNRAVAYAKVY